MPILSSDIKLVATQVMDDVPEGGGAPTGTVIPDGASNSIFPDISELDRAGGRVNMRKLGVSVRTPSVDGYYGANVIVAEPPQDPRVSITLFSTGETFDRRDAARGRVESYLTAGAEWGGYLLENHIVGQRAIQLFQRPGAMLPPEGRTLMLIANEGKATQYYQYVRVTAVAAQDRTFSYTNGTTIVDYTATIVTCDISDALRYDFPGSPPSRLYDRDRTPNKTVTVTKDTVVADAASYCGATPLAAPVALGALSASVESIFAQLVPSAQTEIPLVSRLLAEGVTPILPTAAAALTYSATLPAGAFGNDGRIVLRTGAERGSVRVTPPSGTAVTDDGAGRVFQGANEVGTIDYATGEILFGASGPTAASGSFGFTFTPAVPVAQQAHTLAREVTVENRSLNWITTLDPIPAPSALEIAYMSGGEWYVLASDDSGAIRGADTSHGAGTISYLTGTSSVTLGALPDVGSQVLYTWGSKIHTTVRAAATADAASTLRLEFALAQSPIVPGTYTGTFIVGGVARSATDAAQNGTLSGTGVSGTINYATGRVVLDFATPPDRGTSVSNAYTWRDGAAVIGASTTGIPVTGGQLDLSAFAPFRGAGRLRLNLADGGTAEGYLGTGGTVFVEGSYTTNGGYFQTQNIGVYNAATGIVTVTNPITYSKRSWARVDNRIQWTTNFLTVAVVAAWDVRVERDTTEFNPNAITGELVALSAGLTLDLTTTVGDAIVADSVIFRATGKTYVARAGALYTDIDATNGSGLEAGAINYATGTATLTYWADNTAAAPAVDACLTRYGQWSAESVAFRTAAAPLRPESMSVTATTLDGEQITGVSTAQGAISGTWMRGSINYEVGTGLAEFGQLDQGVWVPRAVDPGTVRYSAVAFSYLPLDADLLGLDPVRLPSDGRVPIFRPGDFAVVGHTATTAPAVVGNGQTINLGRTRLSRVRVVGADSLAITAGYTTDLDAGTVTFTDVTGYAQPVTIEDRIEDMAQVSDVDIGGRLSFTRPLTHDFPLGSFVSSALVAGDLRARVSVLFDQATWGSVWADAVSGNAAPATYNDVLYPPEVTNDGAITERWAIRFTNTNVVEVIGEHVGVIATGDVSTDLAPLNPATGTPYFTLRALGWGLGWSAGNALRFNTVGAMFMVWVVRTIQQGPETVADDAFALLVRGDVDRP